MIKFANPFSSNYNFNNTLLGQGLSTAGNFLSNTFSAPKVTTNSAVATSTPARQQYSTDLNSLANRESVFGNAASTTATTGTTPKLSLSAPTPAPTAPLATKTATTPQSGTTASATATPPPAITFKSPNVAFQSLIDQANQIIGTAQTKGIVTPQMQDAINQINTFEANKTQAIAEAREAANKKDPVALNEAIKKVDETETTQKDVVSNLIKEMQASRQMIMDSFTPTERETELRRSIQTLRSGRQLLPLELKQQGISAEGIQAGQINDERVRSIQEGNLLFELGLEQEARQYKGLAAEKQLGFINDDINLQLKIEDRINEKQAKVLEEARNLRKDSLGALQDIITQFQGLSFTDLDVDTQSELLDIAKQFGIKPSLLSAAMQNAKEQEIYDRSVQKKTGAGGGISTGALSGITQSVISNPTLFDDLTPTARGQVIAELQAGGYDTTNLGVKGLSDTAITQVSQSQKALADLGELKTILQDNVNFLGPISGFQKLNPWSKARQVQADVDRVRQTVGKALEGGVLRKEDEDKYKKILATLLDTPETAAYKIDALISSIQRDIENYKSLQQQSGKSLDVKASLQKAGSASSVEDLRKKYNY